MLRLIVLIALVSALTMPLFLKASRRAKRLPASPAWRLMAGLMAPYLPKWILGVARALRGPVCPRCGQPAARDAAACSKCGNLMTEVSYRVHAAANSR